MVSYKKLYLELKETIKQENKSIQSDYYCPLCNSIILENQSEYYCSNESCKFDKINSDLWYFYAETNNLERID